MALCFVSHLNRVSISVAANERLMPHFGISPERMGVVYSAFLLIYTLAMLPGGLFIDRVGALRALTLMGVSSALFGALTGAPGWGLVGAGWVWGYLLVVRSLMGLCTTPLHPGCARLVGNWTDPSRHNRANGLVTGAALLGIACTYPLFGTLIDWFDWPGAFVLVAGGTGLVAVLLWWLGADHPPNGGTGTASSLTREDPSPGKWIQLLRNRSLLCLTLSYGAVGYFQYLFFYWIQYYFDQVLHLGTKESRLFASIPTLAMALTMPLGGWLADLARQRMAGRAGRALVPAGGMAASAVLLSMGVFASEPFWIVLWFTLSLAALGASEGSFWATAVEIGRAQGGTAAAIINTGGNGVGLLAPMITPLVSEALGWHWGLALGSLVALLGALCWRWIDPPPAITPSS
jgi:MFS family permease